ncbi:hypothetical protein [Microbulbifer thermotolerans]|uniref:hypothetical protein n=1 Tax=Microbulbifer thermotolerans TaxID=252514 RepID=UPI0022489B6C|nr:hypothetical protein [Microbulbifer thermotolerans]MCX2833118.1 hypothetical protein [Microbulbifer thermotolerans]
MEEITLYQDKVELPFLVKGETHIAVAKWGDEKAHFSLQELNEVFEGYLQAESDEAAYLGVWSKRTCSKFRRVLKDKGITLSIISGLPGSNFKITGQVRHAT